MKVEKFYCDISDCDNEATNIDKQLQIIFVTEQTEGRPIKPNFSIKKIDICNDCLNEVLTTSTYIRASGAQGNDKFWIPRKEE